MMRSLGPWVILALVLLAGAQGSAQGASPAARSAPSRLPRLAVVAAVQRSSPQDRQSLEDLLAVELGNQPFLELVDRQALHAVMKEHAIALANQADRNSAIALGRFAGADHLLHILVTDGAALPTRRVASVHLVEVATGQVKFQEETRLPADLAMFAASLREKVLAVLRPDAQVVNCLTVGITEFPNRSGNQLSDKLSLELQTALRRRLITRPWAAVLERQYPTVLLDELDLARAGLVRGKGVESLPPADLVILGSLEDAGRKYEPGKPWQVALHLTLRLRGHAKSIEKTCRSDAIEAAADELVREVEEFRRQRPQAGTDVPEKELWRRQALYLMPRAIEYWPPRKNALIPNLNRLNESGRRQVIRAWENVLLLAPDDPQALTCLGVCRIGFDPWYLTGPHTEAEKAAMTAQWISASRLLERAMAIEPTPDRAVTYVFTIRAMQNGVPARAREMAQYTLDHPEQFRGLTDFRWIKEALTQVLPTAGDKTLAALDEALARAGSDPDAVLILFPPGLTRKGPATYRALLTPYLDSPDPVARFAARRGMGELLCWTENDPAALGHFDQAIAVVEAAYQRCKGEHRESLYGIFRLRVDACQYLGRPDEANRTALDGARRCMEIGRFSQYDKPVGALYRYCVTQVLGPGQESESLKICDAYIAAARQHWERYEGWPDVCAKREELTARLAGKPVPDMRGLRRIKVADAAFRGDKPHAVWIRMSAHGRKLWFVPNMYGVDEGFLYDDDQGDLVRLPELAHNARSVAATPENVFFGCVRGLYKFDLDGKLLKRYDETTPAFPGRSINEVCYADGKIFFGYLGSPDSGVAALDLITESIAILSPSSRDALPEQEPMSWLGRLWWDPVTPRLYAGCRHRYDNNLPFLGRVFGWSPRDRSWQRYPPREAPRLGVSDGQETLLVRAIDDHCEFHFVKANQTVAAVVPVSTHLGEPAWDAERIWVPTASGLYEVDRATGRVQWLAYDKEAGFLSVLKASDRLWIATNRGLYCHGSGLTLAEGGKAARFEVHPASPSNP